MVFQWYFMADGCVSKLAFVLLKRTERFRQQGRIKGPARRRQPSSDKGRLGTRVLDSFCFLLLLPVVFPS